MKTHSRYRCPGAECDYPGTYRKDEYDEHVRKVHAGYVRRHQKPVELPKAIMDLEDPSMPRILTNQEEMISDHVRPVDLPENISMAKDATTPNGCEEERHNRWHVSLQWPLHELLGVRQDDHTVTTKNIKVGEQL